MRGVVLFILVGWALMGVASATEFTFGRPDRLTTERNVAGSVAIGDANGDGMLDIAVSEARNRYIHQIALYLQRSDGSLAPPVTLAVQDEFGWGHPLSFADLDGDGVDEILDGTSRLRVMRLAGGELSEIASRESRYGCAYIATADIDADGKLDVACHSTLGTPTSATIFYGDGSGGFRNVVDMLTDVGSYGSVPDFMDIRLADATGDGRPDLLVTASRIDRFFVYPNDGIGGISPSGKAYLHPVTPSGAFPAALEVLDIDGDGIDEVVTAGPDNQPDARLNVYRQDAGGNLVLSSRLPIYDSTTALVGADIDGDGDKELLAGHYLYNAVTLLGGSSAGIAAQTRFELPGFGNTFELYRDIGQAKSLALGDLDGDGCIDLAAATYAGVTILHGCELPAYSVPVSDLDGDGFGDLLWRNDVSAEFQMWQWADVEAWRGCALPCPYYKGTPWTWQAVGDFDGDGNSDVFWRNTSTGENSIMLSSLFDRRLTTILDLGWKVVGAGDFDGDDQSDLLWRHSRTGANTIWSGADFRRQIRTTGVTDVRWQVVGIGDFNGDGKSDILWRHATTGGNAIWLSGSYQSQQPVTGVTNVNWRIQGVGDFDGDGKDDIAWRKVDTGRNTIWLSGDYSRQQATTGVTNPDWHIGAVADYDGDGRDDLVWRNGRTGANAIWGSGSYRNLRSLPPMEPVMSLVR